MTAESSTAASILDRCRDENIGQILPLFCDVMGGIKCQQIPGNRLATALERGVVIDGSSVAGFARIEESDLRAMPDPTTFQILPWPVGDQKTAVVICDVVNPDGSPFTGDPRFILKKATSDGVVNVGAEIEFFVFRESTNPKMIDRGGYYDLVPDSLGLDLRSRMMAALTALGIEVEAGHHEVAPSQYEIDLRYQPALSMADSILLSRFVIKRVAERHDLYATFMPKPMAGVNGSGMHIHLSIFKDDRNIFFSSEGLASDYHLSVTARLFLAGLLKRAREIALVTNPWVNSYKRLVPGYEAPVYICWGRSNRSALVRVPGYEPGHEDATRLECRWPDPACNPYLAIACLVAAGETGIAQGQEVPKPVEDDVYQLSRAELANRGIGSLPSSLEEALLCFINSSLLQTTLGPHTFGQICANAQAQIERWRLAVTDFELQEYLPIL